MTGYTKGPWVCDGPDHFNDYTIHPEGRALAIAAITNGAINSIAGHGAEHEANARLIAASPDLLEASERSKAIANRVYQMGDAECRRALSEIFDILAPAIAKAKGEAA